MSKKMEVHIGDKFGDWTVIELLGSKTCKDGRKRPWAKIQCKCGYITEKMYKKLNATCQCINCFRAERSEECKKHGFTGTRLYIIWKNMRRRAGNTIYGKSYENVTVCKEWNDFENFKNWAILNNYTEKLTIDRIDGTKGYSPDNCRWATPSEQASNQKRRSTAREKYKGCYRQGRKWESNITIDRKSIYLGLYDTEEQAAHAYDDYIVTNKLKRYTNFNLAYNDFIKKEALNKIVFN